MLSLSEDAQSEIIEAFNSTFWYLDDLLNIDNNFYLKYTFKTLVRQGQRHRSLCLIFEFTSSLSDGFIKTKIYIFDSCCSRPTIQCRYEDDQK